MAQQDQDQKPRPDDAKAVLTTGDGEATGGGVKDGMEGGTTGATSMTDGDWSDRSTGQGAGSNPDAAPGGRSSPSAGDMDAANTDSLGGGAPGGPAAQGSFASGTYNDRGNVTGPDSPAGGRLNREGAGEGQGDDLANRLGGGSGSGTGLTGAGAASGDMRADRSEGSDASAQNAAGAGGPSAGDVGGMGGVRGHTAGSGRPPGGMSPVQADRND